MKSIIKESPRPAMIAKSVSAVAAPRPETKPDKRPFPKVRCTQITPIGPRGIDEIKPSTSPFINSSTVSNQYKILSIYVFESCKYNILVLNQFRKYKFLIDNKA